MEADERAPAVVRDGLGEPVELRLGSQAFQGGPPDPAAPVVGLRARPRPTVVGWEDEVLVALRPRPPSPEVELLAQGLDERDRTGMACLRGTDDAVGHGLVHRDSAATYVAPREGQRLAGA